jgi:hypothetical protein
LALALGRTVWELERSMDSAEVSEWMAYNQLDPLPDQAWQTGLICSTMVNLWSKGKTKPDDFIPRVRQTRRQSPQEQFAIMQGLASIQQARQPKV